MDLLNLTTHFFAQSSADAGAVAAAGGLGIGVMFMYIVAYLAFTIPMFKIAQKLGHANPWFAFVPILNIVQLIQMTDLEMWWVIVCLLCGIAIIWPFMKLAGKLGKEEWMGILLIVPCINIILMWMWALEKNSA